MSTEESDNITITHAPDKHRYELKDGEKVIGVASYFPDAENSTWDFNSTHVDPEYQGSGLAARLVNFALTDAKSQGHAIKGSCSYVSTYLRKHPELA